MPLLLPDYIKDFVSCTDPNPAKIRLATSTNTPTSRLKYSTAELIKGQTSWLCQLVPQKLKAKGSLLNNFTQCGIRS